MKRTRRKTPSLPGMTKTKRPKYNNVKCEEDGIQFDSIQELRYYRGLKARRAAGEITSFVRPPPTLMLDFNGYSLGCYTADFVITELDGSLTLVENKGRKDGAFRLRWLLAQVLYPQFRFVYDGEKEPPLRRVPKKRSRKNFITPAR